MALSRFVLTASVTIPWSSTWSEVVNGGLALGASNTVETTPAPSAVEVVASGAAAGQQTGPLPQVTFQQGTVIYADSSAGSTGPQLLYQAIGAGNLRAFVDGTDAVGHAGISN
jgi:hypothetical protein